MPSPHVGHDGRVTARPGPDPRSGLVRGLRALVLTVPVVGVSALAHRTADGCLELPGVLLALGLCWPGAVALLGARRRLPSLVLWVVAAQAATHLVLQATCSAPGALVPDGRTLGAHVLAALVLATALHRADEGLWVADALRRALLRLLAPQPVRVAVAKAPAARRTPVLLRPLLLTTPQRRRGPPSSAPA